MTETNGNLCYLKGDMTYIKKFPGKIFEPKKSFRKELKGMWAKLVTYLGQTSPRSNIFFVFRL